MGGPPCFEKHPGVFTEFSEQEERKPMGWGLFFVYLSSCSDPNLRPPGFRLNDSDIGISVSWGGAVSICCLPDCLFVPVSMFDSVGPNPNPIDPRLGLLH